MPYIRQMTDYDAESTTFRVPTAVLTAANFDAQVVLNVNLGVAIVGMTLGALQKITYSNEILSPAVCNAPLAQRENKWLVRYHDDSTGDKHWASLGTADLTLLDENNRGYAEMGDAGPVDAFVDAFEAFVLTELGNAVVVDSIQFVGANT